MKTLRAVFVLASLTLAAPQALAQSSLLDAAKGLLGQGGAASSGTATGILGALGQSGATTSAGGALGTSEIAKGLTEAIWVGAQNVIGQLGAVGGFEADPAVHIPLPSG
jgi:hypothetical protein